MNAVRSTRRANTSGGRQSISSALRDPGLVLHHGELVVDLVHGHELLLTPSSVRSGHVFHVDGFTIFVGHVSSPVASVVPKAVLDANDDPQVCEDYAKAQGDEEEERRAGAAALVVVVGAVCVGGNGRLRAGDV